jgi:rhodanese-related sulfurtransferase
MLALPWLAPGPAIAADDDAPRITKGELKAKLGDPAVTVIDVRYKANWKKSGQKIANAVREDPNEISSWVGKYKKDQVLVFYCD